MAPSSRMTPEWTQYHLDNTFKNCKESTLELAPAAFPSLPRDQPRPSPRHSASLLRRWGNGSDSDDQTSRSSDSHPSPRNPPLERRTSTSRQARDPPTRQARNPSTLKGRKPSTHPAHRSLPKSVYLRAPCDYKTTKIQESSQSGLTFAPSPLKDPNEVHIVNNISWKTIEFWYALPPVDLRKAGRAIQGEHARLCAEGTLQQRAFRPKLDSELRFTILEKLVARRNMLQTKLQLLKYETAQLLNPKKPPILFSVSESDLLRFKVQRLRNDNRRLALEINDLLEQAKLKQRVSPTLPCTPLVGVFASPPLDRMGLEAVEARALGQHAPINLWGQSKAPSRGTRRLPSTDVPLDWPAPEDMAEYGDLDATDWDMPEKDLPALDLPGWDSPESRETLVRAWNKRPTPPSSRSSTSSKAPEMEAGGPQQESAIPRTSKRKAEASSPHDSLSKKQMAQPAWSFKEGAIQPENPGASARWQVEPSPWDRIDGVPLLETPDGPVWVARS